MSTVEEGHGVREKSSGEAREITNCPECGVEVKKKNLRKHLRRQHVNREKAVGGLRPGTKSRRRNPALVDKSDGELDARVENINTELKRLAPGFHADRIRALEREKRRLVKELKARKSSGLSNQWRRWYRGPGKVRHWRNRGP